MNQVTAGSKLDLDQLRTQAKELLKAARSGDAESCARVLRYFDPDTKLQLANAQLVIARENGFASWNEMRNAAGDRKQPDRSTELFEAIDARDAERVAEMLATWPNLAAASRRTQYGWESALNAAADKGSLEISKLLVDAGADVYSVRQSDYPPVFNAHYSGNKELVQYLFDASAASDHGHPPTFGCGIDIVCASRIGMLEPILKHIARDPFAVYRRGCIGESVLHWPAHNGHVAIVEALINAGAVVEADAIGLYGGKPIHWAAEHAPATLRVLLKHGANPMARNLIEGEFGGYTPMHMCARQREQCVENIDLLLAAGADIHALDAEDKTPYDVAVQNGRPEMAEYLRQKMG